MKKTRLPVASEFMLSQLVSFGKAAPENLEGLPIHALIRLVRHSLRMTQAQLARRAGLPQSHVAVIEMGKGDLKMQTLRRIFKALQGDLLVVPRFRKAPDAIVAERIAIAARKKVARVAGTMALEKQAPEAALTDRLIRAEEERMLREPSSEIWEE